jgi:hypothetical protein
MSQISPIFQNFQTVSSSTGVKNPVETPQQQLLLKDKQILEKENENTKLSNKYSNLIKIVKIGLLIIGAIIGAGTGYYFGNKKALTTVIKKFKDICTENSKWVNNFGESALENIRIHYDSTNPESKKFVLNKLFIPEYLNLPENRQIISKLKKVGTAVGTAAGLAVAFIGNMFINNKAEIES